LFGRNFFTEILRLDPADDAKVRQELSSERERNRSLQNEIDFLRHAQLSIQDLERIMELNLLKTTLHQTEVKDTWIGTQKLYENRGDKRTQYASVGKNYLVILTHDLTAKYGINMKDLKAFEDESGRLVVSGVKQVFSGMTGVSDKKQYAEVVNSFFSADGTLVEKYFSMDKKDLQAASDYADWCVNEFHRKVETMENLDSNVYEQVNDSAENLLTVLLSPTGKEIVFSQEEKERAVPLMDYLQQKIDEKKKLLSE
ncbi:MAG: hypothetical protein IJ673_03220, partial [Treponema sp.]|nr:hypothetical protein [Treponema sp.]